jgi:molecular chaperone DnaK
MRYSLGVDLGTTYTAAAVSDGRHAEIVPLGDRSPPAPSVIYKAPDGSFRYGESAERHAADEPERIAREFKRRMGDQTPIFVAGTPMSAHACSKALLGWTIDHVVAGQDEPPDRVTVTCPANWGPYRRELMSQVTALNADYPITVCTEPEAAALHFASTRRVAEGQPVAVYDLGGGTFDAAVLRRNAAGGFEVLGTPAGLEQLGGVDFDEAVFARVSRNVDWDSLDPDDPDTLTGLARLRRDCTEAKEALSSETETTVPILLGGRLTRVRLTRAEFADLIDPLVGDTIDILDRVIRRSGVAPDELAAIVLVGGSARIPLISERIMQRLGRPAVLSAQPKLCVAMGAALFGAGPETVTSPSPAEPRAESTSSSTADSPVSPSPVTARPVTASSVSASPVTASPASANAAPPSPPGPQPSRTGEASQAPPAPRTRVRPPLPVYRLISSGCVLLAVILMLVGPAAAKTGQTWGCPAATGPECPPRDSFKVAASGQPADARLSATPFGIAITGQGVPIVAGEFDLRSARVFLAGPVTGRIASSRESRDVVLSAAERWSVTRFLSVPFAALVLIALFSFAYAESILRPIRRRRTRAAAGELIGLIGAGLGLGIAAALTSWVIVDRLPEAPTVLVIIVSVCAAVGLLAFGWQSRDASRS